jgi:hypothetical protein
LNGECPAKLAFHSAGFDDRIEVAVDGDGPAEHALIVVDAVNKSGGDVRVSLLQLYQRTA